MTRSVIRPWLARLIFAMIRTERPGFDFNAFIPNDKRVKNGPTKVIARRVNMSEKSMTFDGRAWRCVEPSPVERLTVACYAPCGVRSAEKGTRRILRDRDSCSQGDMVSCWIRPRALVLFPPCNALRLQSRNTRRRLPKKRRRSWRPSCQDVSISTGR